MKFLTLALLSSALFTSSAFSASKSSAKLFSCNGFGDKEEWTVEIDLKNSTAAFFDNDTWSTAELISTVSAKSESTFVGADLGTDAGKEFKVIFNKTLKTASLVLNAGTDEEETLDASNNCQVVKDLSSSAN